MRTVKTIDWSTWQPVDHATLLFVIRDGRILLIHKKKGLGAGKINGPGGRIESGETAPDAAVREVQEELNITPSDVVHVGVLNFQFTDGYSIKGEVFTAAAYEGTPTETDEAIPHWFDLNALPYDRMWADDRIWVPLMLAGKRFEGWFVFEGDSMLDYRVEERDSGFGFQVSGERK